MTVTKTMKEAIWLQRLLDDLRIDQDLNNCDSMSAIYLVKNQIYHARIWLNNLREILTLLIISFILI